MGCGMRVYVEDGRPVRIEGDRDNLLSRGFLCEKGRAALELVYHPNRLRYPLRRVGERGSNEWQQVTWDDALELVAGAMDKTRKAYGAESVALHRGYAKGQADLYIGRFANVFGTPNFGSCGYLCFVPRMHGNILTSGHYHFRDFRGGPKCLVFWGENPALTMGWEYLEALEAVDKGAKVILIDVKDMEIGSIKPDLFIQPRPGSDAALALGMINVIIEEGLGDNDFIEHWTVGFSLLKEHVKAYSPERVAEITWVPADKIRQAARMYANAKPAIIVSQNALENGINALQGNRATSILAAISGNIGVAGGEIDWEPAPLFNRASPEWTLSGNLSREQDAKRISAGNHFMPLTRPQGIPFHTTVKAILEEDPYAIRVVYLQGTNPVVSAPNARRVSAALKRLDFLVVSDFFMTPSAAFADVVLPVASFLEFDSIYISAPFSFVTQAQQKVVQIDECWPDWKIYNELARKLGMESFCWKDEGELLDYLVAPSGMKFEEFRQFGQLWGKEKYGAYQTEGFATPSGKVELYSSQLEQWGFAPLPVYSEPPETPYSNPEMANDYPLIASSRKMGPYQHSAGRQISSLRACHPDPVVEMHPTVASRLGVKDGDYVFVENRRGRIRQRAALTDSVDPRVILVDYGWWFPERGPASWEVANINILTQDESYAIENGSPCLRFFCCKVYPAHSEGEGNGHTGL